MEGVATLAAGKPKSRTYEIVHRIADRLGGGVASAFVRAIARKKASVDMVDLASAVASGDTNTIEAALGVGDMTALFLGGDALADHLEKIAAVTGQTSAGVLSDVLGVEVRFNAIDPNVIVYAREQAGTLIRAVSEDTVEAVRIVLAQGAWQGLTVDQQARAIREIIGLPPNWAEAPLNLATELRDGRFTSARRLSAVEKAQIRKRLREGTMTDEFVERMQGRYAASLINRRAKNIARTESSRAAHHGLRQSWKQAVRDGHLPETARRVWVVTPDDRLRPTHAAIPGLNEGGVGFDEPFATPSGSVMDPPYEPNCRCSMGLTFPGLRGML